MKASIKLYDTDGESEFGFPVKIVLSMRMGNTTKRRRKTIAHSLKEDWDPIHQLPTPDHDDFEALYGKIMDIKKASVRLEFRAIENFEEAFEYLLGAAKKVYDYYTWAEERIAYMKKKNRFGTAQSYQNSIDALKRYAPDLKFSEIDELFLDGFKDHCRERDNNNKTIRHYGIALRAIYNAAVKAKKTDDRKPFNGFFKDIPAPDRRRREIYIDEEGIRKMKNAQDLPMSQQRAVDLSLLQFYFCGLDLKDVYYLKWDQLQNGRAFLERSKLGVHKYEFDMLVVPEAEAIIEKYKGEDAEFVFPWDKDYKRYKTFYDNHYRDLKKAQEKLGVECKPKKGNLTSKVIRHTFSTLGKFKRIEDGIVRELQNHEIKGMGLVYNARYPEEDRDAAQLEIISV